MPTVYYGDDSTRNPTVIFINETTKTLNELIAQYSSAYTDYILILENPPNNVSKVTTNAGNADLKSAYNRFVPSTSVPASTDSLQNAQNKYEVALSNGKSYLADTYTQINQNSTNLVNLIDTVDLTNNANRVRMDSGATKLLEKIAELQTTHSELVIRMSDNPNMLEGNYETSQLTTRSNFVKYVFYLLFAIVVVGCLCLLYFFPSAVYLDMFILALAGIIIVYYSYDYFQNRSNSLNK